MVPENSDVAAFSLYKQLADKALALGIQVPASHNTLFRPSSSTLFYFKKMYSEQIGKQQVESRPGGVLCRDCASFHMNTSKQINKREDIILGNQLEACFQSFFEEQLLTSGKDISCLRADTQNLHMPDFVLHDNVLNQNVGYIEFKVIFRPFISIKTKVDPAYECYSHSLTLDIENGKKLVDQRNLVENQLAGNNVIYVYWYDLPCIKGIFWMPANEVYTHMDTQIRYERKNVPGDFNRQGQRNAAVKKIYLPLIEMRNLPQLIQLFF